MRTWLMDEMTHQQDPRVNRSHSVKEGSGWCAESTLFLYHYIINYHKTSSLKQHLFMMSQCCSSEVQAWHGEVLRLGAHQAEIKVSV